MFEVFVRFDDSIMVYKTVRCFLFNRWGNSTGQGESSTYRRRVGGVVAANANQPSPLGSPLGGGSNNPADLQNPLSPNGENSRR